MKTKTTLPAFFFSLCFAIITITSKGQAPGSSCPFATLINGNGNIPCCTGAATITDFTSDGVVPSCLNGTYRRDGWYKFINPALQNINVTASSTTASSNLILQVFGVCGGAELGCVNNLTVNGAQTESMCLLLAAGTYLVKITNYSTSTPANMALSNVCVSPCATNNDCANATTLTPSTPCAACSSTAGTTTGATQQGMIPATCTAINTTNDDVWYTFMATSSTHTITVTPCASMNPVIEVFSSNPCGGAGTSLGCTNANGAGVAETATLTGLTITGTYWFRVYDAGTGIPACGTFTVCVQTIGATPCNDDCSNPYMLTSTSCGVCSPTSGTLNGATPSGYPATCGGTPNDDVWYSFVATAATQSVTVVPCASSDIVVQVFADSCGTGNTIACANLYGSGGTETATLSGLIIGNIYFVRVYDFTGGFSCGTFTICLQSPPVNDACNNATVFPQMSSCAPMIGCDNLATSDGISVSSACPTSNPDDDVWYQFTAISTFANIQLTGSTSFDPCFEVFTGPCGALTSVLCNAPGGMSGGTINSCFATTIGVQYWVRVYDYNTGYPATTDFFFCVLDNCSPIGINEINNQQSTFTISPNPFTLQTTISFTSEIKNTTIKIKDVLGKEIKTITFTGKQLIIDKGEMEKGIYFIQIGNTNRKIIIQ